MTVTNKQYNERGQKLADLLKKRIVFLDGAMGTMIQKYKLEEVDFRKGHFACDMCSSLGKEAN